MTTPGAVPEEKALLSAELRTGSFRFGLLERVEREDGTQIEVFPRATRSC